MARRMHRYEVPVDNQPHTIELNGNPCHVGAATSGLQQVVEFWAEDDTEVAGGAQRVFRVYATDATLPAGARWVGTTDRALLGDVWHLYDITPPPEGDV